MAPHKDSSSSSTSSASHEQLPDHDPRDCLSSPISSEFSNFRVIDETCARENNPAIAQASSQVAANTTRPSRRFTVSPVPNSALPVGGNKNIKRFFPTKDTGTGWLGSESERQALLEASSPVQDNGKQGVANDSYDTLQADWLSARRCRHASEGSCQTVSTVLTLDEVEKDGSPKRETGHEGDCARSGPVATQGPAVIFHVDNLPTIVVADEDKAQVEFPAGQSKAAEAAAATDVPGEAVSQWDVSFHGLGRRDDTIHFYVGSTYTLRSAASKISFFDTLYAKGYAPICRICHQMATDATPLETPCHCKGSLRFVHHHCLLQWLDMRERHFRGQPQVCELCHFQFHPRRAWRSWSKLVCPPVPIRDRMLHIFFLLSLATMLVCTGIAASLFTAHNESTSDVVVVVGNATNVSLTRSDLDQATDKGDLSRRQLLGLACGVFFCLALFVAVSAQLKAHWNVCRMVRAFIASNHVLFLDLPASSGTGGGARKPNNKPVLVGGASLSRR